jgi:hypothetical protein
MQPPLVSVAHFRMAMVLHCHINGQFFHFQCMQYVFAIIPKNPLDSVIDNSRVVSPVFSYLKYSLANTWTTVLHNLYIDLMQVDLLMRIYSSTRSSDAPHTSILTAAMYFQYESETKFTYGILLQIEIIIITPHLCYLFFNGQSWTSKYM